MTSKLVYRTPNLRGHIALVAGTTRGAGRGIAVALGEAGATVYCTGRSSRKHKRPAGRPETIEETAELVTAAGGHGISVRVDHTQPADVKKLVAQIKHRHKGLDILVNDVWGGDALTEFGKPFWTLKLDDALHMLKQAIHSYIITSHYAAPLMLRRSRAIIFEITDGDAFYYRGNLFYDLVKISVIRLAFAMSRELRKPNVTSVALTPGFLRSERVLEHFGVTEANWKDAGKKRRNKNRNSENQNDAPSDFMVSETPRYVGPTVRIHRHRRHSVPLGRLRPQEIRQLQNLRRRLFSLLCPRPGRTGLPGLVLIHEPQSSNLVTPTPRTVLEVLSIRHRRGLFLKFLSFRRRAQRRREEPAF